MSWSWRPCSAICPARNTMMLSALRIVDSRCATTTVVRSCMSPSRADWTSFSLVASSAEVASSRRRMRGFETMARAIAMRCFWPPLSSPPLSPHIRSSPSGLCAMNSIALAWVAAAMISSSVAFSRPYRMFSLMLVANSTGSCDTRLSWLRRCFRLNARTSCPSMSTCPDTGS
mmetsp:Transcript_98607/g.147801  ORF Transcript_98607/g.147801 Transcript_98607/m.147801 type:complete len:173 (-) Transcript_98607:1840-2358(-)